MSVSKGDLVRTQEGWTGTVTGTVGCYVLPQDRANYCTRFVPLEQLTVVLPYQNLELHRRAMQAAFARE